MSLSNQTATFQCPMTIRSGVMIEIRSHDDLGLCSKSPILRYIAAAHAPLLPRLQKCDKFDKSFFKNVILSWQHDFLILQNRNLKKPAQFW